MKSDTNYYMCFTDKTTTDEQGIAAFVNKYGFQPEKFWRQFNMLWVGPIIKPDEQMVLADLKEKRF